MASLLASIMAVSVLSQPVSAAEFIIDEQLQQSGQVITLEDFEGTQQVDVPIAVRGERVVDELSEEHISFLQSTLQAEPESRMSGFVEQYTLSNDPTEMVDIVVQFRTPPAVALRLMQGNSAMGSSADSAFANEALQAHERFTQQLNTIPVPFGISAQPRVTGSHYTLLNAMFMTAPVGMVEQISNLPEVFMVTPNFEWFTAAELAERQTAVRGGIESQPIQQDEQVDTYIPLGTVYVPHPEFNRAALNLFEMDYIHENIATGYGIRIGIIDTGVDYRHPFFERHLVPADWGHVQDEHGNFFTLPGANYMGGGVAQGFPNRPHGPNTSPMENLQSNSNHGTHVAGTALAMAPDAQLYAWRVLTAQAGANPAAAPNAVTLAIEDAYDRGLDVINLSLGHGINTPWDPTAYALNLVTLAGMVVVGAAGNDGAGATTVTFERGGWFSIGGGVPTTSLAIVVGSSIAGGRDMLASAGASVNSVPTEINLIGASNNNVIAEDTEYDYVWFGRMELPSGGRNNPAYASFLASVQNQLLEGGDLAGKVAVINRGGGEFVTMMDMAYDLGAIAFVLVNNLDAHATGITLNNPGQQIPAFSVRMNEGHERFGDPVAVRPVPEVVISRGVLNFGRNVIITTPEILTASSGVGPLGPVLGLDFNLQAPGGGVTVHPDPSLWTTMHIKPDILAPGVNIVSTNTTTHTTTIDGRPYTTMGGTSMASPAIAGIVALMIEEFPNASPVEIKARLMNTARDLNDYSGRYSVMQQGAGFVVPLDALRGDAFATAEHPVPLGGPSWDANAPGRPIGTPGVWSYETMGSLSFGNISVRENTPTATDIIPVTVHGSGNWTASYDVFLPTQELARPAGRPGWGPPLTHTETGFTVVIDRTTPTTFDVSILHDGTLADRGLAQGYITLTNGIETLRMPFAAYFDIELPTQPLAPLVGSVIARPILSAFVNTPYNYGAEDIRAHGIYVGPDFWIPGDTGVVTQSNYSSFTFGFADPAGGGPRSVRLYYGPEGTALEDKIHLFTSAPIAPGTLNHFRNPISTIMGGDLWTVGVTDARVVENGTILAPGVWAVTAVVEHEAGAGYTLEQTFHFMVTDERPTIELEGGRTEFIGAGTGSTIPVTGRVVSPAVAEAITREWNIATGWAANNFVMTPASQQNNVVLMNDSLFAADANGEFTINFNTPTTTASGSLIGLDARSLFIQFSPATGVVWAQTNRSLPVAITLVNAGQALADLQYLVDYVNALDETDFTPRSWANLAAPLERAENILVANVSMLTVEAITDAYLALRSAVDTLVESMDTIDLNDLGAAIAHAQGLTQSHFNRGSWNMLQQALTFAITVYNDVNATPEETVDAAQMLWSAINNLVSVLN